MYRIPKFCTDKEGEELNKKLELLPTKEQRSIAAADFFCEKTIAWEGKLRDEKWSKAQIELIGERYLPWKKELGNRTYEEWVGKLFEADESGMSEEEFLKAFYGATPESLMVAHEGIESGMSKDDLRKAVEAALRKEEGL